VLLIAHRPGAILAADRVVELNPRTQDLSPTSSRDLSPTSSQDLIPPSSPDPVPPSSPDPVPPSSPDPVPPSSPRRRGSLNPPAEDIQ
jgi:hypothetical protein